MTSRAAGLDAHPVLRAVRLAGARSVVVDVDRIEGLVAEAVQRPLLKVNQQQHDLVSADQSCTPSHELG